MGGTWQTEAANVGSGQGQRTQKTEPIVPEVSYSYDQLVAARCTLPSAREPPC